MPMELTQDAQRSQVEDVEGEVDRGCSLWRGRVQRGGGRNQHPSHESDFLPSSARPDGAAVFHEPVEPATSRRFRPASREYRVSHFPDHGISLVLRVPQASVWLFCSVNELSLFYSIVCASFLLKRLFNPLN